MNSIEKTILEKFKTLLLKRVKLHALVLFGSRAKGNAETYSDMDVLVVVDDLTREVEDYISDCAWEAGFETGIVVVPVVFSRNEWESGPERYSLLAEAVKTEGVYI